MADRRPHPSESPADTMPDDAPALAPPEEAMVASARLASQIRHAMTLGEGEPLPSLDDFLLGHALLGSTSDLEWLISACCPGEEHVALTLARLREHILTLDRERSTATAKFMEVSRALKQAQRAPAVGLAQAAQLFYQAVYPEVREHLDIAVEQLGQPLERVILGVMGHYRDNLHGVDMSLVPDQLPTGVQTAPSAGTAATVMQRTCPVCTGVFAPKREKPNQLYCGEGCGAFAYATQTWARNAARTPDMSTLPTPDPYACGIAPGQVEVARQWQAVHLPRLLDDMQRSQERQTGVRRVG